MYLCMVWEREGGRDSEREMVREEGCVQERGEGKLTRWDNVMLSLTFFFLPNRLFNKSSEHFKSMSLIFFSSFPSVL